MRLATAAEARRLDEVTQSQYGVSAEALMEAAGTEAAREIAQSFIPELRSQAPVVALCGPGNNGGDGLVIIRQLASQGFKVLALCLPARNGNPTPLFQLQLERARKIGLDCREMHTADEVVSALRAARPALVVDALFGIGLKGKLEAPAADVVEFLNKNTRAPVIAIDTPSGLDVDRGLPSGGPGGGGVAVRATMTVTFGLAKPGFFVAEGSAHVGRLRILSIGFPKPAMQECANSTFAFTERNAARRLPTWGATSHKTNHGHALIFAGSPGMFGAGVLSSHAAYRIGSGYVTLASYQDPREIIGENPEILTGVASDEKFWVNPRWTACAIGPGLGTGEATRELIERLKRVPGARVVMDADAITVAARDKLFPLPPDWILTPHAGELSRVLPGASAQEIESDRFRFAREGAKVAGCHVLLKGYRTVVANHERATVVLAGNSALAKAGTGDVLTGMIVGLLAQGLMPLDAALTGAFVHGRIADEWVQNGNSRASLMASDLARSLPPLLERLKKMRRLL